jgi:type III secretory pathway component EscS
LHLARASWGVLRKDRSLVVYSSASVLSSVVAFNVISSVIAGIAAAVHFPWLIFPGFIVAGYAAIFCAISCSVALAGAVELSLDGRDTHFSDGWSVAKKRRKLIAQWAGVQLAFGIAISAIDNAPGGPTGAAMARRIAGTALTVAWSVATFFVVPLIALEGLGPREAVKRSAHMMKGTWGETLSGRTGIGLAVAVIAGIPLFALFYAAGSVPNQSSVWAVILYVVAFTVFVAACAIGSTLNTIFRLELYRFSKDQQTTAGFSDDDVIGAFA